MSASRRPRRRPGPPSRDPTPGEIKRTLSLLEATLDSTADGILVVDAASRVTKYNRRFLDMWRIPADLAAAGSDERLLAFVLEQLTHPDAFLTKVKELYAHPEAASSDLLEFKDGRVFERYSQPQRVGAEVVGRVWSFRDVSERHRYDRALQQSRDLLVAITEGTGDAVFAKDLSGRYLMINTTGATLMGTTVDLVVGRTDEELWPPEVVRRFRESDARILATGQLETDEETRDTPAGPRTLLVAKGPLRDQDSRLMGILRDGRPKAFLNNLVGIVEGGRLVRIWGTQRDITDRKRAEQVQSATYRISEAAGTVRNLGELYRSIHEIVSELIPATNFYVALYEPAERLITFPYFVDEYDAQYPPKRLGKGLTEYVLRTGRPLLATPDVYADLERRGEVELIGAPSLDWMGVPLRVGDEIIGVLVVQTYSEGVRYGEAELSILQFVSDQVARAIERRRAAARLAEVAARYQQLFDANPEAMWVYDEET